MFLNDIFSIEQFQITPQDSEVQLYQRAYALPEFFSQNLVHENRIVKIFTGQHAVIKAFYFNYMKLALESQDGDQYLDILNEQFISYNHIKQGHLSDTFLTDFQYRKFFKDFIERVKQTDIPDFQLTAQKYPIIDKILEKLFKSVLPIELLQPKNKRQNEFQIANQIILNLCQRFQQSYQIEIPQKCIRFLETQMFLYFQDNEVYLAYINIQQFQDSDQNDKTDDSQSLVHQSFVCSQGNSFKTKFKLGSLNKFKKSPLKQLNLENSEGKQVQNTLKKTESFSLPSNRSLSTKMDEIYEIVSKTEILQSNGSLIRRRSRNSTINKQNRQDLLPKPNCFVDSLKYSQNSSGKNQKGQEIKEKEKDLTNTLINLLNIDSHGCLVEEDGPILPSALIEKAPQKCQLIMRRRSNKPSSFQEHFNNQLQMMKTKNDQIKYTPIYSFEKFESAGIQKDQHTRTKNSLALPQSKQLIQIKFVNSIPNYNFRAPQMHMQEIIELGQDEDSQEIILNCCQVESQNSNSYKTVNLNESLSKKLNIQQVQSRNIDISRTSISQELESQFNKQPKSFQNLQNFSNYVPSYFDHKINEYQIEKNMGENKKKSFEDFMKEMRAKINLKQNSHLQFDSNMEFSFKKGSKIQNISQSEIPDRIYNDKKNQENWSQKTQDKSLLHQKGEQSCQSNFSPSGSDEFTKSYILLLLDQEYRQKIRAIKNDYKSSLKDQYSSFLKQQSKMQLKTKSLIKESPLQQRSRQPSIHILRQ